MFAQQIMCPEPDGLRCFPQGGFAMHEPRTGDLLRLWQDGEADARDRLIGRLYPELSQIAAARLRRERDSSLSTGDLINDAVIRLVQIEKISLSDRAHF